MTKEILVKYQVKSDLTLDGKPVEIQEPKFHPGQTVYRKVH